MSGEVIPISRGLPEEGAGLLWRALADPTRRRILDLLRERPRVVQLAMADDSYLGLLLQRWFGLPFVVYAYGNEILEASGRCGRSHGLPCGEPTQ